MSPFSYDTPPPGIGHQVANVTGYPIASCTRNGGGMGRNAHQSHLGVVRISVAKNLALIFYRYSGSAHGISPPPHPQTLYACSGGKIVAVS